MTEAAATAQDTTQAGADDQSGQAATTTATEGSTATTQTKEEAATTGDGATGDQGKKDGDGKATEAKTGAPEKYEFKAPEGFEKLDDAVVGVFEPIARELNLTNEQAQKLVDLYGGQMARTAQAQQEALVAQAEAWANATKGDKEIGGAAFDSNIQTAQKAIAKFATPELKSFLDESGMGNHPEVVRVFLRIGKVISEDTVVTSASPAGTGAFDAKSMYPNSNHA